MPSPPWMPLYVGDYLADTGHLTTVEHGAYLLLIMHYWRAGSLPANDKQLSGIARLSVSSWQKIRPTIQAFFEIRDEGWYHGRIVKELVAAREKYEKRSRAGAEGARAKWGGIGGAATRSERLSNARQIACHTDAEWLALADIFGCCVKCGVEPKELYGSMLCKDHITPIAHGGSDGIDNIQPMCRECNSKKGGDTVDYRDRRLPDWRERLAKRLANACVMPAINNHNHSIESKKVESSVPLESIQNSNMGGRDATRPDYSAAVEAFWKEYPKRDGANPKAPAIKKLIAAIKSGVPLEAIIAGTKRYRAECADRKIIGTAYVAQAVTWLNQQRWGDYQQQVLPAPAIASWINPEDIARLKEKMNGG